MTTNPSHVSHALDASEVLRIEALDACVCADGSSTGVRRSRLTAMTDNVEVWSACARNSRDGNPYAFDCNHTRIEKGTSVEYPPRFVQAYGGNEGAHLHVRPRSDSPHVVNGGRWIEMPLQICSCDTSD